MKEWIGNILTNPEYLGRFTLTENILLFIGVLFWVYVYGELIYKAKTIEFVEMPVFIACGNIVWEFLWGFIIQEDMGIVLKWGYRLAFILDVVIFYYIIKYGKKQWKIQVSDINYYWILFILCVSWAGLIYTFQINGYDLFTGSNSAYILNLFISGLYPVLFLSVADISKFSFSIAWTKFIGTAFFSWFLFLFFPDQPFVLVLAVLVFLADFFYLVLFYKTLGKSI